MPPIEPITQAPSRPIDLENRVAVVTGAARGLGREIAVTLASNGARVALIDLREGNDTVAAIGANRGIARSIQADVTDRDEVVRAFEKILRDWGRIDILVNNAGIGGRIGLADISDAAFMAQMSVNLKAAMYCTQQVAPIMAELGGGKIVNISSISARVGGVDSTNPETGSGRSGPIYAAAKGGLLAFTRWSARDLGSLGILVNAICPGPIKTDATTGFEYDLRGAPLGRLGHPGDVAHAVLFLASQMSNHVTGQTINVDGGLRMD